MKLSDFDYDLPRELIAQTPARPRDSSRLMVVSRKKQTITHDYFYNLSKYLAPGDLLVFNNTKVFPARLYGKKDTGGRIEILLLNPKTGEFIGKNIGRAKRVILGGGYTASLENGRVVFDDKKADMMSIISKIGYTPLPPYIVPRGDAFEPKLRQSYQTVYAKEYGSAAAPTAGLHFTKKLIGELVNRGIDTAEVTLHVGLGTFAPVKSENIENHEMHSEYFEIGDEVKDAVLRAKRVVAVGTTSVRVLESDWSKNETNIFIYPGYKFKNVDVMITNFHLPKSTLLLLVSAFAGRELVMKAYAEAIKQKYRFFSFGDAMILI